MIAIATLAVAVAGCGALGDRTWIAQGPGDSPEVVRATRQAQARPAAAPQGATAARRDSAAATPAPGSVPGAYTQATRYGDLLFVSGQIALAPGTTEMRGATIEEQTRQVMENIRGILEAHRLTMANVVSTTVYMKDLNDFRGMDDVYESYFRSSLPSRSVIQAARLPRNALVEIAVVAGR